MRAIRAVALLAGLAPLLACLLPLTAGAEDLRHAARWGTSVGVLADPVPSILGLELSYDLTPAWRLHAGTGAGASPGFLEHRSWSTTGGGVRFLPLPQRSLSPVLGASLTFARVEWSYLWDEEDKTEDTWTGGLSAGLDWQTKVGFNVAFGGSVLLQSKDSPFHTAPALPYLRLGWLY